MTTRTRNKDKNTGTPINTGGGASSYNDPSVDDPKSYQRDLPGEDQSRDSSTKNYDTFQEASDTDPDVNVYSKDDKVFTIQEAVDSMGFGAYQIKLSCMFVIANIGESMELMLLPVLSPTIKCVFHLNSAQESILSMVVFLGMLSSSNLWGKLGDKYGRKTAVLMSYICYCYFGVLASFSPSYSWIVVNRFLVALGLGGFVQTLTLNSEFIPTKTRGQATILMAVVWSSGACLEVLLAMVTLSHLSWRWLLFFTASPTFVFLAFHRFLPESPRYLLSHGRHQEALDILKDIARTNGKNLPEGRLYQPKEKQKNQFRDLFIPKFLRTTLLTALAMSTSYMSYTGTALLTTSLLAIDDGCHGYDSKTVSNPSSCESHCTTLGPDDYFDLFVTSLGDLPGIFICLAMMQKLGRLRTLGILMVLYTLTMVMCNLCLTRSVLVMLLFFARAMITGTTQGILLYTTEVYPTPIRASGMGFASSVRCGAVILAIACATILVDYSAFLGITSFAAIGCTGAVAYFTLPYETKGKSMSETLEESFI